MRNLLLTIVASLLFSAMAHAATIEESGIAGLRCEVWRQDSGAGTIDDRIRCTYSTFDESGATVRRAVSTTLSFLTAAEVLEVQGCIETAFASIYSREALPVPTPRPTPGVE